MKYIGHQESGELVRFFFIHNFQIVCLLDEVTEEIILGDLKIVSLVSSGKMNVCSLSSIT